ncbi:PREDICTED: pleckstrin homology domain-containing family G member 3 [Calidris pugnax]|uniref:pleckstrin homology domain-containing family G member 3 n=1 Tax=Calidris pugnax TaxID=198806 RepID=UPI00071E63C0|nr:PREDICTED: pleckstrin homology domain-containing family G member 3 [Calidris pugnax]
MPVPACLSLVPEPGRAMEEPADGGGAEPWAEGSVAALAECMRSKAQARFLRECQERLRHALPLGAYLLKPVQRILKYHLLLQTHSVPHGSVAALAECMRSKAQARFLRECQERLRHALPLGAYLLKPVQRILKYHLLLQEIAKHFEHKSGEDYEVVLEAIDTMTCVAWYINDMKRKHEHAIRQQEIQSLLLGWKGPDLTSYGELVLEGTFRVQRVRHERAVFLFDKTLLITKRRGDHYVYKSHIPCSSLMLIESTRDSLCFSLAHYKHGKQQHNLQAKSVEEKRVWTHHIKRLILENHHAIIPQKAKEAILEMDLFYPPRLPHCSPERLKKSWSCQPLGDNAAEPRQCRRQSEPFQPRDRAETLPDRLHGHTGRRQSGWGAPTTDARGTQAAEQLGARELREGQLPAPPEPPSYVQIRSPTTREKICLKAVVERCKAYQASEEYRRRCPEPPDTPEAPEPPRHGLVRDLRQKFQTLDAAS